MDYSTRSFGTRSEATKLRVLFISPPARSLIEPSSGIEHPLEVALPRIPFEVLSGLQEELDTAVVDLEWELDKAPDHGFQDVIEGCVRRCGPDVVLTTIYAQSMTDTIDQICSTVKLCSPGVRVVVGGQAIPYLRERVLSLCPNVDIVCEDVHSLEEAIRQIRRGYRGRAFLSSDWRLRKLHSRPPQVMYCGFPITEFVEYYRSKGTRVVAYLENQRGCPYKCTFCAAKRPIKERAVGETLAEARFLLSHGISTFYLIDLTFGVNEEKTRELLDAFSALRFEFPEFRFRCITRVDYLTAGLAQRLASAGCYEVGLGVESASNESLTWAHKGTTRDQSLQAILNASRAGLCVRLFLILGLPADDFHALCQFLQEVSAITSDMLIQPSLLRDIVGPSLEARLASGELHRGVMHQLDFRTDGRRFGLDRDQDIVNYILLSLAWPSTEISRRGDTILQNRLMSADSIHFFGGSGGHGELARANDLLLIDTNERKLIYAPTGNAVQIRQCLLECGKDYFDFLRLADGTRSIAELKDQLLYQACSNDGRPSESRQCQRVEEIMNSLKTTELITIR